MKLVVSALALAATLLALPARAAPITDVFGRSVPVGAGRPALVFYANQATRKLVGAKGFALAYDLRAVRPVVVVRIDLRDVPGLFHGLAEREIRKAQEETLAEMRAAFRRHGEEPPPELADSLFMIADNDGGPHAALGLGEKFGTPFAKAFGPTGKELARGRFPSSAKALAEAISRAPQATASN